MPVVVTGLAAGATAAGGVPRARHSTMAKPVITCLIFPEPLPELRGFMHRGDDSPCPRTAGKGFVVTCTSSGDQARSDWRDRAACVGEDPEIFFPLSDLMTPGAEASLARAICRRCPVIIDCRTWALDHGEDDGIWGATTAAQRRSIRRAVAEPVPATRRSRDERGESGELAVVLTRLTAVARPVAQPDRADHADRATMCQRRQDGRTLSSSVRSTGVPSTGAGSCAVGSIPPAAILSSVSKPAAPTVPNTV